MDICKYINSRPIRDYLKEIEYGFNTKEAAWLINQCNSISLVEKHKAWKQLMKEMPDYNLGNRFDYLPDNSLYELIRRNIKNDEKLYELFKKKEADAVYQYRLYCSNDSSWCEDYEIYASLEECWTEIEEDMDLGIEVIDIRKRYISSNKTIEVRFTPNKTIMNIYSYNLEDEDLATIEGNFDEMWFDFPLPFEKGDILVPVHKPGPNYRWSEWGPIVIDSISSWDIRKKS